MRISDWSSDVCSSVLTAPKPAATPATISDAAKEVAKTVGEAALPIAKAVAPIAAGLPPETAVRAALDLAGPTRQNSELQITPPARRSEEHTSELQSLMRISYAVFCLKKTNENNNNNT